MMTSNEIRKKFLDFFESKQHTIVPSAPMVVKNDPTLMFTNAGMNQFKDIFLGNAEQKFNRAAERPDALSARIGNDHDFRREQADHRLKDRAVSPRLRFIRSGDDDQVESAHFRASRIS